MILTVAMVAKPYLTKTTVAWEVNERLNLETKYCGEVIGDDVQLRNRKQVTRVKLSDRGKNMTRNLETWKPNKEPENKINQNIKRDINIRVIKRRSISIKLPLAKQMCLGGSGIKFPKPPQNITLKIHMNKLIL